MCKEPTRHLCFCYYSEPCAVTITTVYHMNENKSLDFSIAKTLHSNSRLSLQSLADAAYVNGR